MKTSPSFAWTLWLLLAWFAPGETRAEPPLHRWLSAPLQIETPHSYFTNLQDGARIETPYLVRFGLAGAGLAPIPRAVPNTGHHHLLINRDLPLEFNRALPFTDQYVHFGKGQMEGVLDLPAGTYTLRLLLADHAHIPLFVYSNPIQVTVTHHRAGVDPKSLLSPGVELLSPHASDVLRAPFPVRFHAAALAVGHADVTEGKTGHFQLRMQARGQPEELIDFRNGLTEAWLAPPPGNYQMTLQLVSNAVPKEVLATAPAISVRVSSSAAAIAPPLP